MVGKTIRRTVAKNGPETHNHGDKSSAKSFHDTGFEIFLKTFSQPLNKNRALPWMRTFIYWVYVSWRGHSFTCCRS